MPTLPPLTDTINGPYVHVHGPNHHYKDICQHIASTSGISVGTANAAFPMVEHAISAAWAVRRDDLRALTFHQFHQVVQNHFYADLYGKALQLEVDTNRIGVLVADIAVALATNAQLN